MHMIAAQKWIVWC